jgi:hypothetical protein
MATREEFLKLLWEDINGSMHEHWIENTVRASKKKPNDPFSDIGSVVERLIKLGADRRDLCLLKRFAHYETTFSLLYRLGDPGIDKNDFEMLHELLLSADPSGKEGRPGSAP